MCDEYSIAMFDDGRTDIIPNYWIQDYLKNDNEPMETSMNKQHREEMDYSSRSYTVLENINSHINEQINKARESAVHEYEKNIRDVIYEIRHNVTENTRNIKQLQQKIDYLISMVTGEEEIQSKLILPACNLEEFIAIDEHIQIKNQFNVFVENFGKVGGKTVEATTRKIWNKLCTTKLASSICWTGANGKFRLKNLKLNELVLDAVLKTHPNGKESEIQRATMLWFSHAQDRLRAKKMSA